MLAAAPGRHSRAIVATLLTVALVLGTVGTAPVAEAGLRGKLLTLINRSRANHGLRAVRLSEDASRDAKRHTKQMIRRDRLFHLRSLEDTLRPYRWHVAGEFVGCAKTVRRLFRKLLRSPQHRALLLEPHFRWTGLGLVRTREGSTCGPGFRVWATGILWG